MFRQTKKHAASTSSVGHRNSGGGGDYLGYQPTSFDNCKSSTPVLALGGEGMAESLLTILFGDYSLTDVIIAKVGDVDFGNSYSQFTLIDDALIENIEALVSQKQQQGCHLFDEMLDYVKHYKGKTMVVVSVSTDSAIPTPEYCDIYLNGELLYSNLAVSTQADMECCEI